MSVGTGATNGVGTGANGSGAAPGTGAAQSSNGSNGSTNNGSGLNNNNGGVGNGGGGSNQNNNNGSTGNNNELEKLIQSAVDRATQRLGTENKELRTQIQQLQQLNMTDAEKHEHELSEREKQLKAGEAALQAQQNRMYAMTAIKNAGLDDGSVDSMALIDLVVADDQKGIDAKVKSLTTLVNGIVQKKVKDTFAANGRQPGKGDPDTGNNKEDTKIELGKQLGKRQKDANAKAQNILKMYTGG